MSCTPSTPALPDDMHKLLYDTLQQSISAVKQGGQWLAGQIPDVLTQLVKFHLFVNIFVLVLFTAILLYSIKWLKWGATRPLRKDYFNRDERVPSAVSAIVFGVMGIVVSSIVLFSRITETIELIFAPKVWLLEYVASLVKHA